MQDSKLFGDYPSVEVAENSKIKRHKIIGQGLNVIPESRFVIGIIKDRSAKAFRASKDESSSTKKGKKYECAITTILHTRTKVHT